MKPLRILFLLIFFVGLVLSAGFGLRAGPASAGWLAAMVMSLAGLAWTAWGESGVMPGFQPQHDEAPAEDAGPSPVAESAVAETESAALPLSLEANALPAAPIEAEPIQQVHLEAAQAPRPALGTARNMAISTVNIFEEYFQRAPVPLIVITREGHIERMNHAAEAITQYATAEVRSQPYWNLFFMNDADAAHCADGYRTAMLDKKAPPCRETWQTRMGSLAQFEWWRTVLKDDFGQATGILAAALPVAPESATSGVDLTALADQLTAVNGYSEFLLMAMDAKDPLRHDLESIHRAGMAASQGIRLVHH